MLKLQRGNELIGAAYFGIDGAVLPEHDASLLKAICRLQLQP